MRYASLRNMDISNGLGVGVALFTQGCERGCPGCFNPETWDMNGGKEFTEETKQQIIKLLEPNYITRFSIVGGEPLLSKNSFMLATLIQLIRSKRPDIKIWVYTGYTYEELREMAGNSVYLSFILTHIDVLVDGPFIEAEKDITLPFCGSRNQRVINMQKTIRYGKIVELDL